MPPKPQLTTGDPNELVKIEVQAPRWLKNASILKSQTKGKSLSDWSRDLLAAQITPEDAAAAIAVTVPPSSPDPKPGP
jgi:hypothetical protein